MEMRIRVNGMSCSHCQARVEKGLSELDGVTSVRVDLPTGTATVVGDVTEAVPQLVDELVRLRG